MRTILETFAINEVKQFAIAGGRIEILSCSAAGKISISLQDANGVEITNGFAKDIDAGSYMQPAGGFQRVAITSSVAQDIKFLISNGESGTRSVAGTVAVAGTVSITGNVNVISSDKARTLSNSAFLNYANSGGNAGYLPHNQLWNPNGSGKNLVVESIVVSSGTAQALRVASSAAGGSFPTAQTYGFSKQLGGAAGVGQTRTHNTTAAFIGTLMYNTAVLANTPLVIQLREPIIIPPNYGLIVAGSVVGADAPTTFEYFEE